MLYETSDKSRYVLLTQLAKNMGGRGRTCGLSKLISTLNKIHCCPIPTTHQVVKVVDSRHDATNKLHHLYKLQYLRRPLPTKPVATNTLEVPKQMHIVLQLHESHTSNTLGYFTETYHTHYLNQSQKW